MFPHAVHTSLILFMQYLSGEFSDKHNNRNPSCKFHGKHISDFNTEIRVVRSAIKLLVMMSFMNHRIKLNKVNNLQWPSNGPQF